MRPHHGHVFYARTNAELRRIVECGEAADRLIAFQIINWRAEHAKQFERSGLVAKPRRAA